MAFKPVSNQPEETQFTPDAITEHLRSRLPGHDDEYYSDLTEKILITATARGNQLASTVEAFIIGAENRGEGIPPATEGFIGGGNGPEKP